MVMSVLVSALVVGRPDAGFAATPGYEAFYTFKNAITGLCLHDPRIYRLDTAICSDAASESFRWHVDYYDSDGHGVGTLQNMATGTCLDDSAAYGLRDYLCDPYYDAPRIFQQFRLTPVGYGFVLQNMATGSCVDDSDAYGLRGYICNGTYFQEWRSVFN
jgi:hypothetical protein